MTSPPKKGLLLVLPSKANDAGKGRLFGRTSHKNLLAMVSDLDRMKRTRTDKF